MKIFSKIFYTLLVVLSFVWTSIFSVNVAFAQDEPKKEVPAGLNNFLLNPESDKGFISISHIDNGGGIIGFLKFFQDILLKLVLPLVAIGCGLYIAYLLFTAEWDESKMKKVWTAVTYGIIGIVSIMLAYFVVDLITRINF